MPTRKPATDLLSQQGQQALDAANFQQALKIFNEALKKDSTHEASRKGKLKSLLELGKAYQEEPKVAEVYFKQAHEFAPDNMEAAQELAKIRHQLYLAQTHKQPITEQPATSSSIENLVFQGGGIKGLAYLGAIEALFEQHIPLSQIKRVGGASAGAINATFIGLGYQLDELKTLLKEVDFTLFMDGPFRESALQLNDHHEKIEDSVKAVTGKFESVKVGKTIDPFKASSAGSLLTKTALKPDARLITTGLSTLSKNDMGLFPGDYFREDWAERLIQAKTGIAYLTFAELNKLKEQHPEFKDIYLLGLNLNTQQSEVFSYETTPNMIISDALRISISIPLFFKPHQVYLKQDNKRCLHSAGHYYADGGLLDNYPLWLFDKKDYLPSNQNQSITAANSRTLGFRLVNTGMKKHYEQNEPIPDTKFTPTSLGTHIWRILGALYNKQESDHHLHNEQPRTIYIDHLGVKTTEFDLSPERQEQLINSGRTAVNQYFVTQQSNQQEWFKAAENLDINRLSELAHSGVIPNIVNAEGNSALDIAVAKNASYCIIHLVKLGVYRCKTPDTVRNCLQQAKLSPFCDASTMQQLLQRFNEQNIPRSSSFYQPAVSGQSVLATESVQLHHARP